MTLTTLDPPAREIHYTPYTPDARSREEVLLDAAALMEEHGWTNGGAGMPGNKFHKGQYCLLGAIAATLGYRDDCEPTYEHAALIVFDDFDRDPEEIFGWNDGYYHTDWEMVRVLRRLAAGERWDDVIVHNSCPVPPQYFPDSPIPQS